MPAQESQGRACTSISLPTLRDPPFVELPLLELCPPGHGALAPHRSQSVLRLCPAELVLSQHCRLGCRSAALQGEGDPGRATSCISTQLRPSTAWPPISVWVESGSSLLLSPQPISPKTNALHLLRHK